MTAYVPVPRDLTQMESKIFSSLTKKQLPCFGAAVVIGSSIFFLLRMSGNVSLAIIGTMIVMFPPFFLAMYEEGGQPLEVIAKHLIESKLIRPKERPYKMDNYYAALMRRCRLDKEVETVVFDSKKEKIGRHRTAEQSDKERKKRS